VPPLETCQFWARNNKPSVEGIRRTQLLYHQGAAAERLLLLGLHGSRAASEFEELQRPAPPLLSTPRRASGAGGTRPLSLNGARAANELGWLQRPAPPTLPASRRASAPGGTRPVSLNGARATSEFG
jgi:hypothetical protein